MTLSPATTAALKTLEAILGRYGARYRHFADVRDFGSYVRVRLHPDDEETIVEPVLTAVLEEILGFPADAYFPQLSKSGSKPDFTPADLVAHPFVLDAKSSAINDLDAHEPQIRGYIEKRGLLFGVLFNLREVRVYPRGRSGHDPELSFRLLPLWQVARGEALPTSPEVARFEAFVERCRHHALDLDARIVRIRRAESWSQRELGGERPEIDVEYLVSRLRALSRTLQEDASAQQQELDRALRLDVDLEPALVGELRTLANDLQPGIAPADLPDSVAGFRVGDELAARVWSQFLLRVSQLALIRILLYRSWEDAGFVDERLYDGGFGRLYDRLRHRLADVLEEAFNAGRDRYPWLYGGGTTYDWYRPSDGALVEVLYTLLPVPLGKLNTDVLGGLYESYVDDIDRDRLGQFYTPRSVVRFMLDRAGFAGDAAFEIEGDRRRPRKVLDFATGSGGFLVEAARRIVDEVVERDPRDIEEGLAAISGGLHGCEISPFPYYLSEVNLLLQVSRLLGRLRRHGESLPRSLRLGIVHADTLATRLGSDASFGEMSPDERADRAALEDRRFGLAPLDPEKSAAYERMTRSDFDFVVGNPPYVFESGNRALFERLRGLPGWTQVYSGKGDYLYYFLMLAAERLAPDGRMAVIVPAGWMNAGEAGWLRETLAKHLRLDELFLFGGYRLFAPEITDARDRPHGQSPTVESAILIATKAAAPADHQLRIAILEDERAAARALHPEGDGRRPEREALLAELARRADAGRGGRRGGIFVHSVRQGDLRREEPWPVKFGKTDLPTRVVAHLDRTLRQSATAVEPLGRRWNIFQGIQTGADAYIKRIHKRLSPEDRMLMADRPFGTPILELPAGRELEAPWNGVPHLLARSVEATAILYGSVDDAAYTNLVWISREDEVPDGVKDALEPWKRVLATRAEFVRNARRRWFETAWPRDKEQMRAPKVIALYRTDRGRFALDETGDWQPSIKTTLCTAKTEDQSAAYLCGLLNSELLDLWYAVRGKRPRDVWRNYEPKPMARIPYVHVGGLAGRDPDHSASAADVLEACDAILTSATRPVELARALGDTVRAVDRNRRALLPLRHGAPGLAATIKDPWRTTLPVLDPGPLIEALPPRETVSARLDPELELAFVGEGPLGRPSGAGSMLRLVYGRRTAATVAGPPDRLALLQRLLTDQPRLVRAELEALLLPKDLVAFDTRFQERLREIERLLDEGHELVERAERLTCRLYGVGTELEDEIVAHAVERAREGVPDPSAEV